MIMSLELELKGKHRGKQVLFLDRDIKIADSIFVYKLFDKKDEFLFFIVRMTHLLSNAQCAISYGSIFSDLL